MSKPANLGRGLGDLFTEASSARTTLPSFEKGFATLPASAIRLPDWMSGRLRNTPALDDLAVSIKERGVLQPVLVRKVTDGYELISGARRYASAIRNGQQDIPALILTADEQDVLDIYLQENVQHLSPIFQSNDPETLAICAHFNITPEDLLARIKAITPNQTSAASTVPDNSREEALADAVQPSLFEQPSEPEPKPRPIPEAVKTAATPYKTAFYFSTAALCCALVLAVVAYFGRRIERVIVEVPAPVPTALPEAPAASPENAVSETALAQATEIPQPGALPAAEPTVLSTARLPNDLINALAMPEVIIRPGAAKIEIIFREPVFSYRSEINAEAEALLVRIAQAVAPWKDAVQLRVCGHTDSDPITSSAYHSNVDLGLQRAAAVAEFLHRQGNIPAERLTASSTGEATPPYPNDQPANKSKNRTVTIQITPQ